MCLAKSLKLKYPEKPIVFGGGFITIKNLKLPDYVDFYVLSKLDGCIMSNSTFGWWLSYLGNLQNVVCPYPWVKNNKFSEKLYQSHWIKENW